MSFEFSECVYRDSFGIHDKIGWKYVFKPAVIYPNPFSGFHPLMRTKIPIPFRITPDKYVQFVRDVMSHACHKFSSRFV